MSGSLEQKGGNEKFELRLNGAVWFAISLEFGKGYMSTWCASAGSSLTHACDIAKRMPGGSRIVLCSTNHGARRPD